MSRKKVFLTIISVIVVVVLLGGCANLGNANPSGQASSEDASLAGKDARLPLDTLKIMEEVNSDRALMSKYKNISSVTNYYYPDSEESFSNYLDGKMYKSFENQKESVLIFDYKAGYFWDEEDNNLEYIYYLGTAIEEFLNGSLIADYKYADKEIITRVEETSQGYSITTEISDDNMVSDLIHQFQYDSEGIKRIKYVYEVNKDYELQSYSQFLAGDKDIKLIDHKMSYNGPVQNYDSEFKKYYQNGTSYTFVTDAGTEAEKEEVLTVTDNVPFSVIFPAEYEKAVYMDKECNTPILELDGSCTRLYIELK